MLRKNLLKISTHLLLLSSTNLLHAASYKSTPETLYLEKTSKAFSHIAKDAMPCTIFIKTEIEAKHTSFNDNSAHPFDHLAEDFFQRFFGKVVPNSSKPSPQKGSGSGFFISKDGHILTNNHVIDRASKILAVLNDGREYEATVVGTDPRTDLAVIKIEENNLPYLSFGNSDELDIGEWVIAIGNPFALESSLTVGVVSAKGRQDLGITTLEDFIQTDAAINPGNSGGPLLNLSGDVIGINTAIATRSGGYMGIGFAIPAKLSKHVVDQLMENGVVQRAYVGIIMQPIDKELAEAMNLKKNEGILITEVVKNSPASKAGLETGDIILEMNSAPTNNMNKFRNDISMMSPGTDLKLKIKRREGELYLNVRLETLSEAEVASQELFQQLGIDVNELHELPQEVASKVGLSKSAEGVIITKVKHGSPAAIAGIRPYQTITGVVVDWQNQKKVTNLEEFHDALEQVGKKKYVVLIVRHKNYQRYYTVKLP